MDSGVHYALFEAKKGTDLFSPPSGDIIGKWFSPSRRDFETLAEFKDVYGVKIYAERE